MIIKILPVYIIDKMTKIIQKSDRVLRKRKIHNVAMDKITHNTVKRQKMHNVMNEHNYYKSSEKKCCQWPDQRKSPIKSYGNSNKISLININENVKEDESLPDRFTTYECVSEANYTLIAHK